MVSFVLNVAHAEAGDWPARGVAAIPPAALVLSVELLVLIARRAALARTTRLTHATRPRPDEQATVVARSDQPTTTGRAQDGDQLALEATTSTDHPTQATSDHPAAPDGASDQQTEATSDHLGVTPTAEATLQGGTAGTTLGDQPDRAAASGGHGTRGATYQRVRELYESGMTVAAEIARELGVSASYAQRTLRRVKADLAHQPLTSGPGRATTPDRTDQATSEPQRPDDWQPPKAQRSPHQATTSQQQDHQATRDADGDGRTTTTTKAERHLALVAPERDQQRREVER
jgi:hypothetical protein